MSSPQTGDSNPQLKNVFFHGAWKPKFQPQIFDGRIWEGQYVTLLEDLRGLLEDFS